MDKRHSRFSFKIFQEIAWQRCTPAARVDRTLSLLRMRPSRALALQ